MMDAVQSQAKLTRNISRPDPANDKEVMEGIDAFYFLEDGFDAVDHEFKKLSSWEHLAVEDVEKERFRLRAQLQVVSRTISTLILEKSPSYSSQMEAIMNIRDELSSVIQGVKNIRNCMSICKAKSSFALSLLAMDQKKKKLQKLKQLLLSIRALHEMEFAMQDLLEAGKFTEAIKICLEAVGIAKGFSHFHCVVELTNKLIVYSEEVEAVLDSTLASLVVNFDPDKYLLVHSAYALLGKTEVASERLVVFIKAALERRARQVIESHLISSQSILVQIDNWPYEKLCESVSSSSVCAATSELAFSLCQLLMNVHGMMNVDAEEKERHSMLHSHSPSSASSTSSPSSLVSSSLYSIFRTAVVRFNTLLCCHDFSSLKLDDILIIIEIATKMRRFGRRHFGHSAAEICASLEKQSALFFSRQHSEKMDELGMFLENEAFTPCPLPPAFSLFDLPEFSFLREEKEPQEEEEKEDDSEIGQQLPYSLLPPDAANPFASSDVVSERPKANNRMSQWEEKEDGIKSPNLCNSALVVLRLLGRYIRMASLLQSIADRVIVAVTQLFHYFFFSIVSFFSGDCSQSAPPLPLRLTLQMETIQRILFSSDNSGSEYANLRVATLSSVVQLNQSDTLFALAERVIAIESLEFVCRQLELTRPVIESLLGSPSHEKSTALIQDFYSQMPGCVSDVRVAVMSAVASRALKLDILMSAVCSNNWSIDTIQSAHSTYVDFLLQDLEVFSLRLQNVALVVSMTGSLRSLLYDRVIYVAFHTIVEGYSKVGSRCSPEGRALMQLDLQQLAGRLQSIIGCKPTQQLAFVDTYIKAYYLPEKKLEEWALSPNEYTKEQKLNLLCAASHVSKKTRIKVSNALQA